MAAALPSVRFIPEGGHHREPLACTLSASPGSRKLKQNHWNALDIAKRASARLNCVAFVSKVAVCTLSANCGSGQPHSMTSSAWTRSAYRRGVWTARLSDYIACGEASLSVEFRGRAKRG